MIRPYGQGAKVSFLAGLILAGLVGYGAIADEPGPRKIPDPAITPGAFASTDVAGDICAVKGGLSYSRRHRLSQTPEVKRRVLDAYGVPWSAARLVEDDHILPLCSGGADTVENRWPQYRSGTTWTAGDKDRLEAESCRELCAGSITQDELRARFMPDWRVGYCATFSDRRC